MSRIRAVLPADSPQARGFLPFSHRRSGRFFSSARLEECRFENALSMRFNLYEIILS